MVHTPTKIIISQERKTEGALSLLIGPKRILAATTFDSIVEEKSDDFAVSIIDRHWVWM